MQNTLREALRAQSTFDFVGNTEKDVKLCLLPGIYSTLKAYFDTSGGMKSFLSFSDPSNLQNAGYACDQVADDFNELDGGNLVKVTGVGRVKYRDFLLSVQRVGMSVSKIIIQNKTNDQAVFDQQIEVAKTVIGAKGGVDFITLQQYVDVHAYDRSKITIDLSEEPLDLTPEVFMSLNIPKNSHFSIQFVFRPLD